MNKETINIPNIRFSKFFNVWEICKLKEISERITKKNSELESTLPLTISAQYGLVDQITYFNKRIASKNITNYYLLERGDFAYNKSYSKDYPWGVVKRLDGYDKGVLSTLYIVFKPTRVNSDFLLTYYDTNNWHKEVSMRAAEGARNHGLLNITALDFFDTNLFVPVEKEEQENIGLFFNKLDKTIAMQQQLLNDHKQLKKAMLQKMFPQKGEKVPRVRFSGFTNEWNEIKLGNIVTLRNGYSFKSELYNENGEYNILTIGNVTGKRHIDVSSTSKISILPNNLQEHQLLNYGDILVSLTGNIGRVSIVDSDNNLLNQRVGLLDVSTSVDKEYVYQLLADDIFEKSMMSSGQGAAQLNIGKSDIENYSTRLPSLQEQQRFGEFFKKLDKIIIFHEKKLETYQELKKAMLQKMFV